MSSSIAIPEPPFPALIPAGWTSSGTARSRFAEGLEDEKGYLVQIDKYKKEIDEIKTHIKKKEG